MLKYSGFMSFHHFYMKRPYVPSSLLNSIAILILLTTLAACSIPQAVVDRAPSGEILYQDDFSDPGSGWDRITVENGITNYADGAYQIEVNEPYVDLWANPGLKFEDLHIQVDAIKAGGPDDNVFGVICRSDTRGDNYYFFVVSSDGYYGVGKVIDQKQQLISTTNMLPSSAVKQGEDTNILQASCIGDQLTFSVNGLELVQVQDSELKAGDIGLTAGSFDKPNVDVRFDNLVVTKP